jgi:hypothetical protein
VSLLDDSVELPMRSRAPGCPLCLVPAKYPYEYGRGVKRWAVHPCGCDITHDQARVLRVAIDRAQKEGAA